MNTKFYKQLKKTLALVFVLVLANAVASFGQLNFSRVDLTLSGLNLSPYDIQIEDINNDGKLDIITSNSAGNSISILTNTGNGIFNSRQDISIGNNTRSLKVTDINNDGFRDVIVKYNYGSTLCVLTNSGNAVFNSRKDYSISNITTGITVGDINNDQKLDFIFIDTFNPYLKFLIYTNTGFGNLSSPKSIPTESPTYSNSGAQADLDLGDLNSDGYLDLVSVVNKGYYTDNFTILTNTGNGSFSKYAELTGAISANCIKIGDLNGDGKNDIAVGSWGTGVQVYLQDISGSFNTNTRYITRNQVNNMVFGDFNGDNKIDIVASCFLEKFVSVLTNTGNGSFGNKIDFGPTGGYAVTRVAKGDLNGDGKLDLAISITENGVNSNNLYNYVTLLFNTTNYGVLTETEKATIPTQELSLYPNPSKGSFTVSSSSVSNYQIYSLEGALLQNGTLTEGDNSINTKLGSGFYILRAGNVSKKLLVE